MSLAERAHQAKLANQAVDLARQQTQPMDEPMQSYHNYQIQQQHQMQQRQPNYQNPSEQPQTYNPNYRQSFNPNFEQQNQGHYDTSNSRPSLIQQQQVPYQGRNSDFSRTNKNDKLEKRQALMANFDDIPIHQLHKADGYQIRNIDDEEQPSTTDRREAGFDATAEEDLKNLSLKDQVFHSKWKVRMNAFKLINQQLLDWDDGAKEIQKEDEMYGDPENPFDVYGPILEQMIKDTNLTAQYEGLNCLYSYVKHGKDIKSVTFACHSYLLDKIQHNKPNFKDITQRILQQMLMRNNTQQNIVPELLKRFKSKNRGALNFCLGVMNAAVSENNITVQDANLKLIYKATHDLLGHSSKEIRDSAVKLILFVYENCEDDLNTFVSHLTSLRPV